MISETANAERLITIETRLVNTYLRSLAHLEDNTKAR